MTKPVPPPAPDQLPGGALGVFDELDLLSLTTGGLPYPESTGPANQGANDIKALALALEARGHGQRIEARSVSIGVESGGANAGIATVVFAQPFATPPFVTAITTASYGGAAGNTYVPAMGILDMNATQVRFFVLAVPWSTTPPPIQPWGGVVTLNYIAIGTAV